jgi:hypothetical protein
MRHPSGIFVLFGILGAVACGGASQNDFSSPVGASGQATTGGSSGTGGSGAQGGSTSTGGSTQGGTGGSNSAGGTGGSVSTGGSVGTGGSVNTGGASGTSGTGGDATGGTSGASGSAGTGGTGMETGGSAGTGAQAGGAGGAGGSKGGMGGSGGMATVDCDALAMDYATTLEQAQACNPNSGKDQCTDTVKGSLTCGCNVFINPDNTDAVAHLEELRTEAGTHCVTACPAIACVTPGATCTAVTGGAKDAGRCTTQQLTPAQ